MNKFSSKVLAQFKNLPQVYRVFILAGLFLFAGNSALDLGDALGRFLFQITH